MTQLKRIGVFGVGAALSTLAGCASVPPPTEQVAVSQAAVAQAEGAQAYEFAPVAFNTAQEKLSEARIAMEREEYLTARRLAEQAEVDARLAFYAARNAQTQKAVQQLQESIETLQRELETGS